MARLRIVRDRQAEIYIRSLIDPGSRWQVSAGGGTDPRWRGNGQELNK
jgi:hypothetical protein